jgi:hypothetical protein
MLPKIDLLHVDSDTKLDLIESIDYSQFKLLNVRNFLPATLQQCNFSGRIAGYE